MGLSWRNPYSNFVFFSLNMRLTRSILFLDNRFLQWWGQGGVKFHHACKITWSVPVRWLLAVACVMSSNPPQLFVSRYPKFNVNTLRYLSRSDLVGSLKGAIFFRDIDKSLKKFGFVLIVSSLVMRLQFNLYRRMLPGLYHSGSWLLQTSYSHYRTTVFCKFSKFNFNYTIVLLSHFNLTWPSL